MNNRIKVFLVDDHPVYLKGLKALLERETALEFIGEAGDGDQAFNLIHQTLPDIALIDLLLPKLNGVELIKKIKSAKLLTKIVVISQSTDEKQLRELIQMQIDAYVLKSEGSDEILRGIEAAREGKVYYSPGINQQFLKMLQSPTEASVEKKLANPTELSKREKEVAVLISEGKSVKQMASHLGCSENTIKSHKSNLMRKIGVSNSAGVSSWAHKSNLVS